MGGIITEVTGQADGNINKEQRAGGERTSGESSSTSSTGTTAGTGGRGAGGSGTGTTAEEKKLSGLALLNEKELEEYQTADDQRKKQLIKNAKRRQKYADQKASEGTEVKPRKVRKKAEPVQQSPIDKTSLNMIIMSISGIIASRPGQEHWMLTEAEVNSITEPLSKMIAESSALANLGQYSNQIALVMACGTVFVPRLIVSATKSKEKKKNAVTGQTTNTNPGEIGNGNPKKQTGSNSESDRKNDSNASGNGANNGSGQPWFGSAISY